MRIEGYTLLMLNGKWLPLFLGIKARSFGFECPCCRRTFRVFLSLLESELVFAVTTLAADNLAGREATEQQL